MKANEAPEKIYIDADENWHRTYTAYTEKAKGNDIEYVCKDAFIEKAVGRLKHYLDNGMWIANDVGVREKEIIIEDFEEYLKK
jgi:hypothetical protein